jgi:hypothetical protein
VAAGEFPVPNSKPNGQWVSFMDADEISNRQGIERGSDFFPQFLPLSDLDNPPPKHSTNPNDLIRWKFLSVYHDLNLAYAKRHAASRRLDHAEENQWKNRLEELTEIRDGLEDQYAPYGVIAEVTFEKCFAVNIAFTFPNESRWFHEQKRATSPWEAELQFQATNRNSRSDS